MTGLGESLSSVRGRGFPLSGCVRTRVPSPAGRKSSGSLPGGRRRAHGFARGGRQGRMAVRREAGARLLMGGGDEFIHGERPIQSRPAVRWPRWART